MWQGNEYPLNWKKKAKAISLQLGLHRSKIPDLRVLIGIASVISFSKKWKFMQDVCDTCLAI